MLNTLPSKASIAPCPPPQSPAEGMELSEMSTQCISNFSALPFQDFCPSQMESRIVSTVTLPILPPCILMIFLQDSYMPTKAQISHILLRRAFCLVLFSGP